MKNEIIYWILSCIEKLFFYMSVKLSNLLMHIQIIIAKLAIGEEE